MRIVWMMIVVAGVALAETEMPLEKARVDLTDLASLQRGVTVFMNRCASCHGLRYVRYNRMARDIGLVDSDGAILSEAIKQNLLFTGEKLTDTIETALTKEQAAAWFGVVPPDLSLIARSRGPHWLYTYLNSFYLDAHRPWGVNNHLFPEVAMPDVLYDLRGTKEYERTVLDLVNFLSYAAEPTQLERKRVGIWVMLFLGIFCVFAFLLKREYWKDIKE